MNTLSILNLTKLDNSTVKRIGDVLVVAMSNRDTGVIEWAARAAADARMLGKLRERDEQTLDRLERNYRGHYLNGGERVSYPNRTGLQAA